MSNQPQNPTQTDTQTKPLPTTTVQALPLAEPGRLSFVTDIYLKGLWTYEHPSHTLGDVIRPGYWDPVRLDREFRVGTVIQVFLGSVKDGCVKATLMVAEIPSRKEDPILVCLGAHKKFTPCRHDGSLDGDRPAVRKSA